MSENPTRRSFLKTLSLAGAALAAGAADAEAGKGIPKGAKKVWAWINENGCLEIESDALEAQLTQTYATKHFICVSWDDPNSEGNKINSLCTC